MREAITVTGASPVIDTTTASVGHLIERRTLETLPNVGRNPFVISTITPNVIPTGVPQFTRMQDQNATAMLSLGGGPRRANNFLLDGVPITDLFNRAAIIPSLEAVRGSQGAGLHLRCRARTDRRRCLQHDAQVGVERMAWQRDDSGTSRVGCRDVVLHEKGRPAKARYLPSPMGRFGRRSLLPGIERSSGRPRRDTRRRRRPMRCWCCRRRPSGAATIRNPSTRKDACIVIHDPLTTRPNPAVPGQFIRDPFPGNVIPAGRINPVAATLVNLLPLPATGRALTTQVAADR